eukprot:scaffold263039_cov81-Attheya_sp.AAC.1
MPPEDTVLSQLHKESVAKEGAEVPTDSSPPVITLDEKRKCFVYDAFQDVSELCQLQKHWIAEMSLQMQSTNIMI